MSQDPKNRFSLEDGEEFGAPAAEGKAEAKRTEDNEDYASEEKYEQDKGNLIDFLQYPKEKRKLTDFMEGTYKGFEQESVDRTINRVNHEHESELQGSTPWHKPGHIGSLMYEFLNMIGVEMAFVSGLQHTKSSMTKTVQQRVDEINTLLRGVGGFNRQIKASFARSAVIYLEQEDPRNTHRERVMFTINLSDFELRYPLDESADQEVVEDGRTVRRMVWDEAVNTLCEIVSNTGMKPKYVKNDKNSCNFTMQQYLLTEGEKTPDEYFSFHLNHVNENARKKLAEEYDLKIKNFDAHLDLLDKKISSMFVSRKTKMLLQEQRNAVDKDKLFFIGTHPDPKEMDCGLVFSIFVNTMKDYTITKDKMQVIMTKYILALSKIAVDKSMDQQVNTVYTSGQKKPVNYFQLEGMDEENTEPKERVVLMKDDLIRKKRKAG
jgi:hypothetical protein